MTLTSLAALNFHIRGNSLVLVFQFSISTQLNLFQFPQNKHISKIVTNKILVIILTLQAAFLRSGLYRVRLLALIFAIFVSKAPETEWKRFSEIVCDKNKSVEFRDCKVRVSVNFFGVGKIYLDMPQYMAKLIG